MDRTSVTPLDAVHNAWQAEDIYYRRSAVETIFFALKQRYGATLRARTWFGQFRELVCKIAVSNIEIVVSKQILASTSNGSGLCWPI